MMFRTMLNGKIHRATVTEANLNYVGSITIDQAILEQVDMLPNEKVQIVNNNNGARLETYIIKGPSGSGMVCLNGAAARSAEVGDTIIIMSYGIFTEEQAKTHQPKVVILGEKNKVEQVLYNEKAQTTIE